VSDVRSAVWLVAAIAALTLLAGQMAQGRALKGQDASLARIEQALELANGKVGRLNGQLDHLATIDSRLATLTRRTVAIERAVGRSAVLTARADRATGTLVGGVAGVNAATGRIGLALGGLDAQTRSLSGDVLTLKGTVDPLAADTSAVRGSVGGMESSLGRMNGSLRYVIRILNYLAVPPGGGSFSVNVSLDKASLPNLPDLTVDTAPIAVFRRGAWPTYHGR
jgi:outer membrane murein-binding lipoprotein Lpp